MSQHEDPFGSHPDPFDEDRTGYRALWLAFGLGAIALGLQSAQLVMDVLILFGHMQELQTLLAQPWWILGVGSLITWTALLSALLMLGRLKEPGWNFLVGALVLMNSVDVLQWATDCGPLLGLRVVVVQGEWVRNLSRTLQWLELLTFAGLAARVGTQLGDARAIGHLRSARGLCLAGLGAWLLVVVCGTDWTTWPPTFQLTRQTILLYIASFAILGLAAFQVTVLCILAARGCSTRLKSSARGEDDLLKSRSEDFDDWPTWRHGPP